MEPLSQIPKPLKGKLWTAAQAKKLGLSKEVLRELIQQGVIEKLGRGVYREVQGDISEEDSYRIAALRVGEKSSICLVSALVYYGLTDMIPKKTWIIVPTAKRTIHKNLKVFRERNPNWNIGIEKKEGYSITSIERTIVEALIYRSQLGSQIGIEALRRAISEKKTTLGKIMDMAVKLKVSHRILSYIEALS